MRDNEIVLVACNPVDAKMLMENEPEIEDSLIITKVLDPGETIIVPKDEFIKYLREGR